MVSLLPKTLFSVTNGKLLRELRDRAGLKDQKEAARLLGFKSSSALSERENEHIEVSNSDLYRFAAAWGLRREDIEETRAFLGDIAPAVPKPIADICAGYGGLLAPLNDEQRRDLMPDYPIFIRVPDGTMSGRLERGDLALVKALPPERIPRGAHGKVCYVVFTDSSDQGEPEFGLILEHDAESIIIGKTEPGRGPATRIVPLSDIYNIATVLGVYKTI